MGYSCASAFILDSFSPSTLLVSLGTFYPDRKLQVNIKELKYLTLFLLFQESSHKIHGQREYYSRVLVRTDDR
jgi:hypothetical protein